jgi:hypothetical protein
MRKVIVVKSPALKVASRRKWNVLKSLLLLAVGIGVGGLLSFALNSPHGKVIRHVPSFLVWPKLGTVVYTASTSNDYRSGDTSISTNANNTVVYGGSIPSLVQLLKSDSVEQRESAVDALQFFASKPANLRDMMWAGAVPILQHILLGGTENSERVTKFAVEVFCKLLHKRKAMESAVPVLLATARSGPGYVQSEAAIALHSLAGDNKYSHLVVQFVVERLWQGTDDVKTSVVEQLSQPVHKAQFWKDFVAEDGIAALIPLLRDGNSAAKRSAGVVMSRLIDDAGNRNIILRSGGLPAMVPLLVQSGVGIDVANALLLCTYSNTESTGILYSAGFLPVLQQLIDSPPFMNPYIHVFAALTICVNLAKDPLVAAQMVNSSILPTLAKISAQGEVVSGPEGKWNEQAARILNYVSRASTRSTETTSPATPTNLRRRDP